MRVLVSGSRHWHDWVVVHRELYRILEETDPRDLTIVHGACPTGADLHADKWASGMSFMGVKTEIYPAAWEQYGRAAGPIRNQRMVDTGLDRALVFIRDESKGASGAAKKAIAAGVPTSIIRG